MFKIALVHNYYCSIIPSGENAVFRAELSLLSGYGHSCKEITRHSDDLIRKGSVGKIHGAMSTPWNFAVKRSITSELEEFNADIVHVHNTFPLISPAIFHAIGKQAARVLTLHNYRLFCPAAIPMRAGKPCTECLDAKSSLPSMIHGCYRGSRLATAPLAFSVGLHRLMNTWTRQVDAFIALSDFQRDLMVKAGLPREKVHVKPNFYPGNPAVVPWEARQPTVVFAGRLTAEKGVTTLLRAWQQWGPDAPELRLVGDGELRPVLEQMAIGLPIRFLGQLSAEEAQAEIARARLLVLPSEWFEGFPMVLREAFAFGTPAAVSSLGPLPSIVHDGVSGVLFRPADPVSLLRAIKSAWDSPALLRQLGGGARAEFESKYTEAANYAMLMDIYQQAIEVSRHG